MARPRRLYGCGPAQVYQRAPHMWIARISGYTEYATFDTWDSAYAFVCMILKRLA